MQRAYTVNDMLKIEELAALRFGPDGSSVIMEYRQPYEERGLYGVNGSGQVDRGGQILQISLAGAPEAAPLFEQRSGEKYWLGDTSPDGRRLLVFWVNRQQVHIGVYDFETKRVTAINEVPQLDERFEMNRPVWINNREIILSARSGDSTDFGIRHRHHVADRTFVLRKKAFAGKKSDASVSTMPAEPWYDGHLIRYDVNSHTASVLARGRFGNLKLNSAGTHLAALRLGQRLLHFPVKKLEDYYSSDTQLHVFDLEAGSSRAFLPNAHVSMGSLRWSSPSLILSFFAWAHTARMEDGTHHVLEVDSGLISPVQVDGLKPSWTNLVPSGAIRVPVAAEWLQRRLIIHGMLDARPRQHKKDEMPPVNVSSADAARWYEIDKELVKAEPVINGYDQPRVVHRLRDGRLLLQSNEGSFVASESTAPVALNVQNRGSIQILNGGWGDEIGDTIAFVVRHAEKQEVGFLDLKRNEVTGLITDVSGLPLAWLPERQQVVVREDNGQGGTLYLQNATQMSSELFTFNEHLSEIEHPRWETIEYQGPDGTRTFSCVLLPYNYNPNVAYPTIVDIYPGIGKGCKHESVEQRKVLGRNFPRHSNELLSANGYLVVQASNTYAVNHMHNALFGGLEMQVDAALDALVAAGMTDPERIGLWGFSNGSMASLWLASVSNRFKAVVPMFGASSPYLDYYGGASAHLLQMLLGTPIVHLTQYESAPGSMPLSMGKSAIIDPLAYIKASPLDRAQYICSPLMMVHSDLDGFAPFHYEALFTAMYRLRRRAELVRYYGEGHGLRSPGNIRDFYARVLAFFDHYVATGAPIPPCDTYTVH